MSPLPAGPGDHDHGGGGDQTYGEILRLSLAARASIIRAETEQLHVQLDQLRSKAAAGAARR